MCQFVKTYQIDLDRMLCPVFDIYLAYYKLRYHIFYLCFQGIINPELQLGQVKCVEAVSSHYLFLDP